VGLFGSALCGLEQFVYGGADLFQFPFYLPFILGGVIIGNSRSLVNGWLTALNSMTGRGVT